LCPDFPVNSGGDRHSKSLWNLGRLRDATLLKHLPQAISGVTQPWVYVGMCFSSFCWHNEDLHMYSINYLHEGDEKIWYGASGDDADTFEAAAAALFPQLMMMQPDLLCNLVTQIHPQDLVKQGCRIVPPSSSSFSFLQLHFSSHFSGAPSSASRRICRHIPSSVRFPALTVFPPFLSGDFFVAGTTPVGIPVSTLLRHATWP
jgi:hypothetical protein